MWICGVDCVFNKEVLFELIVLFCLVLKEKWQGFAYHKVHPCLEILLLVETEGLGRLMS